MTYTPLGATLSAPAGESLHTRIRLGLALQSEIEIDEYQAHRSQRLVKPRMSLPTPPPAASAVPVRNEQPLVGPKLGVPCQHAGCVVQWDTTARSIADVLDHAVTLGSFVINKSIF